MKDKVCVGHVYKPVDGYYNIKVDRTSPLGNPFYLDDPTDDEKRDVVCDRYEEYFHNKVKCQGSFRDEVIRLYRIMEAGHSLNLQCWCSPRRCHADTIKSFLESFKQNP